jgi:aryl-alcohol dehydrogenase-like predicted oxidoreductase
MIRRTLGRSGITVAPVGIGTWQLGGEWGQQFTQGEADAILDAGVECGLDLIDTAECYGDHLSERLVGDYLSRRDRSRWVVATKFGHEFDGFLKRRDDFSVDGVRRQLEASLRALRVDRIDLYQFHSGPDSAFANDALWSMLDQQRRAGKVRALGASLNKSTTVQADWAAQRGVDVIQVVYNRIDRAAETAHFPFVARDNLGVLARVPLASGLLSGKYGPDAHFAADDVRARWSRETLQRQLDAVAEIKRDEVPAGVPMAQWAIAWCLRNPLVTAVIPGCRNPAQVRDNAAAASLVA